MDLTRERPQRGPLIRRGSGAKAMPSTRACGPTCFVSTTSWRRACCGPASSPFTLALTGVAQALWSGGGILRYVVLFAPLIMVMVMGFRAHKMSTGGMQAFYWAFATVMGLSMSVIPLVYDGQSIAATFFATAAAFASLSLWGYTTKKDLSGFGTFLIMGVVGLIIAMLINIFLRSPAMDLAISAIGVLLFAGLTAYDTQKIKNTYAYVQGTDMLGKSAILGALTLYLDFINMFQFLLSFMGNRD
jgi:FtsH-binding integral membrane protein